MISRRELDYIHYRTTPYPGDIYSMEALEILKASFMEFNYRCRGKEYDISFSDGNTVSFSIKPENLSHMLGLDYKGLVTHPSFSGYSSFDVLKMIVENPKDMLKLNERNNYVLFNFYRISARSYVFLKFSNFVDFNFGCINYVPLPDSIPTNLKSNIILFAESGEINAPFFMMALGTNDQGNIYVESLFPDKYPEKMFTNQRITIPTSISISDSEDYLHIDATPKQKYELLKSFMLQLKAYNCQFDVLRDYLSNLHDASSSGYMKRIEYSK